MQVPIVTIITTSKFDAAHYLPGYEGKCANLHGHTWIVESTITGFVDFDTGMVMDFVKIKKVVMQFDHKCINDEGMSMPTAENLVIHFVQELAKAGGQNLIAINCKVWESPSSLAQHGLILQQVQQQPPPAQEVKNETSSKQT